MKRKVFRGVVEQEVESGADATDEWYLLSIDSVESENFPGQLVV